MTEREYRSRFQPTYREETRVETTVDPPRFELPRHQQHSSQEEIRVKSTVDPPRFQQDKMGYYDEDGKSISSVIHCTLLNLLQVTTTHSAMVSTVRLIVCSMDALIIITMRRKKLTLP